MKAQDLTGENLALWVALALRYRVEGSAGEWFVHLPSGDILPLADSFAGNGWRPDRDHAVGSPIIEDRKVMTAPKLENGDWYGVWRAVALGFGKGWEHADAEGGSLLVAGMRAIVISRYGYENLPPPPTRVSQTD